MLPIDIGSFKLPYFPSSCNDLLYYVLTIDNTYYMLYSLEERKRVPRLLAIMVYSVDEACDILAKRTGWPQKYSRTELYRLMNRYLPGLQKAGKRYFLTEVDLNTIEKELKIEKRPKIY